MSPIGRGYRVRYPHDTMGLPSDFFIATPDVAHAYRGSGLPSPDVCSVGGFTPLEAAAVVAALRGVDDDEGAIVGELEPLRADSAEEWLLSLPHDMVDLLLGVDSARVPELSAKIASAVADGSPVDDDTFEPILEQLVVLAQRARAADKGMYFWGSL